jgi:hypothetical protein
MPADYYAADTEDGDHMDDPSEDGLFILLSELEQVGNTFFAIRRAGTMNPPDTRRSPSLSTAPTKSNAATPRTASNTAYCCKPRRYRP